jgi:hypothetical protein
LPTYSGCPAPMSDEISARIRTHFASLTDPRRRKVTHPLINAENRGPKRTYNLDAPTSYFPRKALARCR